LDDSAGKFPLVACHRGWKIGEIEQLQRCDGADLVRVAGRRFREAPQDEILG
jgi:hypothetical protein